MLFACDGGSFVTPAARWLRRHRAPVRLPQLLAQSALTPPEVAQVQKLLADFLRFMQKNHAAFFVQEYEDEEPVGVAEFCRMQAVVVAAGLGKGGALERYGSNIVFCWLLRFTSRVDVGVSTAQGRLVHLALWCRFGSSGKLGCIANSGAVCPLLRLPNDVHPNAATYFALPPILISPCCAVTPGRTANRIATTSPRGAAPIFSR